MHGDSLSPCYPSNPVTAVFSREHRPIATDIVLRYPAIWPDGLRKMTTGLAIHKVSRQAYLVEATSTSMQISTSAIFDYLPSALRLPDHVYPLRSAGKRYNWAARERVTEVYWSVAYYYLKRDQGLLWL